MEIEDTIIALNKRIVDTFCRWLIWATSEGFLGALSPILTSGYPPVKGAKYISDVDVNVLVPSMEILDQLFKQFVGRNPTDNRLKGWITVSFPKDEKGVDYEFEVNVRFTLNESDLLRTLKHRHNELQLGILYPKLAKEVANYKLNTDGSKRMSTESAWALALGYSGLDKNAPYDYMAGSIETLLADIRRQVEKSE